MAERPDVPAGRLAPADCGRAIAGEGAARLMEGLRLNDGLADGRAPPEYPPPARRLHHRRIHRRRVRRLRRHVRHHRRVQKPSVAHSDAAIATPTNSIVDFFMGHLFESIVCLMGQPQGIFALTSSPREFAVSSAALPASFTTSLAVLRTIFTSSTLGRNSSSTFRPIDFQVNVLASTSV